MKERLEYDFTNIHSTKASIIFHYINDLAERRNDIAHGVENIQLLNSTLLLNYIDFIYSYCESLYNLMNDNLLQQLYHNKSTLIKTIQVINHSILCCELDKIPIDKKTNIIIYRSSIFPQYLLSNILDIQIDNVSLDNIDGTQNVNVGLLLNEKIKKEHTFAIMN